MVVIFIKIKNIKKLPRDVDIVRIFIVRWQQNKIK